MAGFSSLVTRDGYVVMSSKTSEGNRYYRGWGPNPPTPFHRVIWQPVEADTGVGSAQGEKELEAGGPAKATKGKIAVGKQYSL